MVWCGVGRSGRRTKPYESPEYTEHSQTPNIPPHPKPVPGRVVRDSNSRTQADKIPPPSPPSPLSIHTPLPQSLSKARLFLVFPVNHPAYRRQVPRSTTFSVRSKRVNGSET
ncbi:hypothetical protein BaRGS_00000590 [Batillaria attramentaria]|uniref:Uncharacterized protein n=1 Tax=Batillaria attramentaria TaxID=370345 RepID=A0ABD0MB07_9CAEN